MIKKIGFGVIILVVIVVIYSLFNQIIATLNVSGRLNKVADSLSKAEIKNRELKNRLSQIKSPQFVEEVARNKLGLAKPGETVVIIPDEKIKEILGASDSAKEARLPNWLGWLRVFFK